ISFLPLKTTIFFFNNYTRYSEVVRYKEPLSTSLKERLKRTRRSFNAPNPAAKRLKATREEGTRVEAAGERGAGELGEGSDSATSTTLLQLRDSLERDVREKMEMLRRMKMVKMYRTKNDLTELRELVGKWRRCSQAALYELRAALPVDGRKVTLGQLVDRLGLDDSLLHLDRTQDDFSDA
uniref:Swi5-dependent recombination DNA repair protein 1 homolog n=1 Tax=Scleropages formosus TaxID=113540 RepID=A0A8C9VU02_SCLFO